MANDDGDDDNDERYKQLPQVAVVIVPLAAQGHLNQLLHLSRLISAYDIPVHYVGTNTHNRQAQIRLHGVNPNELSNIHFHSFKIPKFPSPPPKPPSSPTSSSSSLSSSSSANMFPAHLIPSLKAACLHLKEPLTELLRSLSSQVKKVVVIHDSLMASTIQGIESISNGYSYVFQSVSAFTMAVYFLEQTEATSKEGNMITNSFPKDLKIPSLEGCFTAEFWDFVESQFRIPKNYSGDIYNTSKLFEQPYLDILQTINHEIKNWAIGPFNPVNINHKKPINELNSSPRPKTHSSCFEWLDRQHPNSVIYVSFGTTTAMDDEQIKEIANGLEKSEQKFIWVLRDADKGDIFDGKVRNFELPDGFERMEERGLVIRDWAPQLEILSHPSTGGFMTHCGWNSCMESITMGVPVAAWPMHSDQPRNAVLMTALLRIGILVKDWDRRDELITAVVVESAVRKLIASEEGGRMRKRAAELGGAVRRSVDDGGVSRVELDSFIAHIIS